MFLNSGSDKDNAFRVRRTAGAAADRGDFRCGNAGIRAHRTGNFNEIMNKNQSLIPDLGGGAWVHLHLDIGYIPVFFV
jgi:hypothetical protein